MPEVENEKNMHFVNAGNNLVYISSIALSLLLNEDIVRIP
jgi:hypothetical protein